MLEAVLDWLRTKRDPLRGEHSAARWAATVSSRDTADIQRKVVETVGAFPTQRKRVAPEHFDALVKVDERVDPIVAELEADFIAGYASSPDEETRLWRVVFELVRVVLAAYHHTMRFASRSADRRWATRLPLLLVRLAHFKSLDSRLRLYRYARWSAAQWREMHQIYELARARRWHHRRLAFGEGSSARELPSIEELYVRTLLEQRMDSGSFTPDQVAWVADRLQAWAAGLKLESRRQSASTFFVDPAGSAGLRRVSGPIPMSRVLYAATGRVLDKLERRMQEVQLDSGDAVPLAPGELSPAEERLVLQRLHGLFLGEGATAMPRAEREQVEQPVRVALGLAAIVAELGRVAPASAGLPTATPASGAAAIWRIADRSRTGFRLMAPEQAPARIGHLVGMELPGGWRVGVVRRLVRLETDEVAYGVETLGHRAVFVEVRPAATAGEATADGPDPGAPGSSVTEAAIYLPASAENRDPTLKAILMRESLGPPGSLLALHHGGAQYRVRLGGRIEGEGHWALLAIEPMQDL